jgi:hypothetical protein
VGPAGWPLPAPQARAPSLPDRRTALPGLHRPSGGPGQGAAGVCTAAGPNTACCGRVAAPATPSTWWSSAVNEEASAQLRGRGTAPGGEPAERRWQGKGFVLPLREEASPSKQHVAGRHPAAVDDAALLHHPYAKGREVIVACITTHSRDGGKISEQGRGGGMLPPLGGGWCCGQGGIHCRAAHARALR